MNVKDFLLNNKKRLSLSIKILCLLIISVYMGSHIYVNYKEQQAQQLKIEQENNHKKEQIEQAKKQVKTMIDNKISDMKCEAKYDLKNSSDKDITIVVTLNGIKNTNIDCKFDRTEDAIDFNDKTSFEKSLDKFVNEERLAEIRHTAIYDYQDILYGMRGKMSNTWDKVKFSKGDDDYTVQETADRFWGGDKAYLVIVDSEWIYKNGRSEWKQICLHMEYDKDNKLIDAKYHYGDVDPDNDIKNDVKADNASTKTSVNSNSNKTKSGITQKDAIEIVKKARTVDENVSSVIAFSDLDKTVDGVKYYHIEVVSKGGHGAASTCYVNSQTGEELDLNSNKDKFNKISNSK